MSKNTVPAILATLLFKDEKNISDEVKKDLITLFKLMVGLNSAKDKCKTLKNEISELNYQVTDSIISQDLMAYNESLDLDKKENDISNSMNYCHDLYSKLTTSQLSIGQDFQLSMNKFIDEFFKDPNLNFTAFVGNLSFDTFNRSDLIKKLNAYQLKDEFFDFLKSKDYGKYSNLSLYLYFISINPNDPPKTLKDIVSKLDVIQAHCNKHAPLMDASALQIDHEHKKNSDKLNTQLDKSLEKLNGFIVGPGDGDSDSIESLIVEPPNKIL